MKGAIPQDGGDLPNEGGERVTFLDQALWAALEAHRPSPAFASAWLTLQCRQVREVLRGVLVLADGSGNLAPAARWPEDDGGSPDLTHVVGLAHEHRRGIASVDRSSKALDGGRHSCLAYPVELDGDIRAIVGVETAAPGDAAARDAMRGLHWGTAWLELALRGSRDGDLAARLSRATAALEIVSVVLSAASFEDQARAAATEVANRTGASRVAVGWVRRRATRVLALSHGLAFKRRMDVVKQIAAAMDEALDQARTVASPAPAGTGAMVTRNHDALVRGGGAAAAVTVPLTAQSRIVGLLLVEFDEAGKLDQAQVDLLEATAALLGPALDKARASERSLLTHAGAVFGGAAGKLLGSGHLAPKLATLALIGVVAFFATFRTAYRVAGRATVEGEVRRTIAASIDGYVATETARAGQTIRKDAVLATLDATEFVLQRLRWASVREQHQLELNKDLAAGQRADVNILRSQMEEADAQIALLDEEIQRTRIVAPFDGVILSGDLSQSVGAPVQRAQVLFEVAPLDAYRVIVRVPDAEIGRFKPGQNGAIVLSALPDEQFPIIVTAVTPVAEVSEGQNTFRVEGRLERISDRLRPNMEGVARVAVDDELLIWIWTHRLVAAVRMAVWSWWP